MQALSLTDNGDKAGAKEKCAPPSEALKMHVA